jgi:hypothetical protein
MRLFQVQAFAATRGADLDLFRGKLRMKLSFWDSLFTPTIERIKTHVVQLLSQPEAQDCKSVLLVRCLFSLSLCVCVCVCVY